MNIHKDNPMDKQASGGSEELRVNVEVIGGVEGKSLYIDDYRVGGPKPWGGGSTLHEFKGVNLMELSVVKRLIEAEKASAIQEFADGLVEKARHPLYAPEEPHTLGVSVETIQAAAKEFREGGR